MEQKTESSVNCLKVKCPGCGTENNAKQGLKKEWVVVNEQRLLITYYCCKGCKKVHMVQLDNEYTQSLLDEISKGMVYVYSCKKNNKQPKKKKANRVLKQNKKLCNIRKKLNKEFEGYIVRVGNEDVKIKIEMQEV